MINSPASPMSRGRGRGRQKELSASERVTNWVNQREAKRLNKERWASRGSGDNSHTGNESHEDDSQISDKQDAADLDSSSDRSKAKRHNVQLYIPPSLRTKKEHEAMKDSLDLDVNTSACKRAENEDTYEKSLAANITGVSEDSSIKSDFEDQQQICEASRTKQRGRGRRKPQVEIYVPRALRTSKHESKSASGIHVDDGPRSLCIETQEETEYCDASVNTNILSSSQTPVFYEELLSHESYGDIPHQELQPYSHNESTMPCGISDPQPVLAHDLATKKIKYELTDSSTAREATSDEQTHLESAGNSLTFEFYDPAVIAFLPSSQFVQMSRGTNISYSMENYSGPDLSTTKCSVSSVSSDFTDEYQPKPPMKNDTEYSFPNSCREIEEESSQTHSSDLSSTHKNEHVRTYQASTTNSLECKNNEENLKNVSSREQDNCLMPVVTVPDISVSEERTDVDLSDELMAVPHNVNRTDLIISEDFINVAHNHALSTPKTFKEFSQKDTSSTNQHIIQTSSDQLVPADGVSGHLKNSWLNEVGLKRGEKASSDLAEDEDSWDALFDDNGDCLDEALITELTEYVGKVEIDKPKINYLNYETKEPEMDFHNLNHILEIYDFSPELATCDLISAFREFSSRGFDVKWVDDTHALGIFSSSIAANEALRMVHPLLKVRSLIEASKKGQSKARHCQEFLQPYKARPETTSIAARRLVAGALGMSPQVSREVREQERKKLKEAKEKRRQERQQKVDIWDGSFGKCAMDEGGTELRDIRPDVDWNFTYCEARQGSKKGSCPPHKQAVA